MIYGLRNNRTAKMKPKGEVNWQGIALCIVLLIGFVIGAVARICPDCEQTYRTGYNDGYSDGDLLLSQNSAMCEIEFNGKASGFLKGLLNATKSLPFNATLELTEADGNLELSGKVKFPCGRMEKLAVEEILPLWLEKLT